MLGSDPARRLDLSALPAGARVRLCDPPGVESGGIAVVEGFLSGEETEDLIAELGGGAPTRASRQHDPRSTYTHRAGRGGGFQRTSRLTGGSVERRIAALTRVPHVTREGCPAHLQLHQWEDRSTDLIHLDKALEKKSSSLPVPWLTALLYLEQPASGGHTLFPLLAPTRGNALDDALLKDPPSLLARAWREREAMAKWQRGGRWGGTWSSEAMHAMCDAVRREDAEGRTEYSAFALPPTPGNLLLVWHTLPILPRPASEPRDANAPPLKLGRLYFHAGCGFSGRKVFLQSFREPPACWFRSSAGGRGAAGAEIVGALTAARSADDDARPRCSREDRCDPTHAFPCDFEDGRSYCCRQDGVWVDVGVNRWECPDMDEECRDSTFRAYETLLESDDGSCDESLGFPGAGAERREEL